LSDSKIVALEDKINNMERSIQQLRTEISIALEFYGQVYELVNELNSQMKKKQELEYSRPLSILQSNSEVQDTKESVIDQKLRRVVNDIFKDYRDQYKERR
jgi:hypothetical protein